MEIWQLPVLRDNYTFILHDPTAHQGVVIDPAVAAGVKQQLTALGATLTAVWITHHHWDHVDGNLELKQAFPELKIYGYRGDRHRIPGLTHPLEPGDRLYFGGRWAEVWLLPGHTATHLAYYFPPVGDLPGELFCGDVLFAGGCGRLSEGTPAQMLASLSQLRQLPDSTRFWCAHEYTLNNLKFALTLEPENPALQARYHQVQAARAKGQPTVPSWLGIEKATNPFLRWDHPALQKAVEATTPLETFSRIRRRKDHF